ncbi:hypothetical protein [Streptomyces sp. NPDC002763]|uniref:hypothetical protein n=1 Tax=Streptomyces sp. NPDC002763 TaxID=3154427 RepID=UPI00331666FC
MAEPERRLRDLVEEGTRASRQPPVADLRRRARRRRAFRDAATVAAAAMAVTATVVAILPLAGSERSGTGLPGPTAPRTLESGVTEPAKSLVASPSETVPGGTITLTGAGCAPGKKVSFGIRWDRGAKLSLSMEEQKAQAQPQATATAAGSYRLASANALATGSFEATVTIPAAPVVNRPTLWAQCQSPTRAAASAHRVTQYVSIVVHSA